GAGRGGGLGRGGGGGLGGRRFGGEVMIEARGVARAGVGGDLAHRPRREATLREPPLGGVEDGVARRGDVGALGSGSAASHRSDASPPPEGSIVCVPSRIARPCPLSDPFWPAVPARSGTSPVQSRLGGLLRTV